MNDPAIVIVSAFAAAGWWLIAAHFWRSDQPRLASLSTLLAMAASVQLTQAIVYPPDVDIARTVGTILRVLLAASAGLILWRLVR